MQPFNVFVKRNIFAHAAHTYALKSHARHLTLFKATGEHRLKVRTARGQHHLVRVEQVVFYLEHDVGEHVMRTHHEHHFHRVFRVVGYAEGHVAVVLRRAGVARRVDCERTGAHFVEVVGRILRRVVVKLLKYKLIVFLVTL